MKITVNLKKKLTEVRRARHQDEHETVQNCYPANMNMKEF